MVYYNKADVLAGIIDNLQAVSIIMHNSYLPGAHYAAKVRLLKDLKQQVENKQLIDFPNDSDWYYSLLFDDYGIKLILNHRNSGNLVNQAIVFMEAKGKIYTVDDFCKFYGVTQGSIRQWIRRGKLPNITKRGMLWEIGELTVPLPRKYLPRLYGWDKSVYNYYGASEVNAIAISEIATDCFEVSYLHIKGNNAILDEDELTKSTLKKLKYTSKEKEKLELDLIANPYVKFVGVIKKDHEYC